VWSAHHGQREREREGERDRKREKKTERDRERVTERERDRVQVRGKHQNSDGAREEKRKSLKRASQFKSTLDSAWVDTQTAQKIKTDTYLQREKDRRKRQNKEGKGMMERKRESGRETA